MIQKLKKSFLGHGPSGVAEVGRTSHDYTGHQNDQLSLATFNLAHGRGNGFSQLVMKRKRIEANLYEAAECLKYRPVDILALQESEAEMLLHKKLHQNVTACCHLVARSLKCFSHRWQHHLEHSDRE